VDNGCCSVKMPKYSEVIQGVLGEINECRSNPEAYAAKLEQLLDLYHGRIRHRPDDVPVVTKEGVDAVHEAIAALKAAQATSPLELSAGLAAACQQHCNDLGPRGTTGHKGADQSTFQQRLEKYGKWMGHLIEALDFGSITAQEVVCSLLVDDGLPSREHRTAVLSANYKKIGVGFGAHDELKSMCTLVMATKFTDHAEFPRVQVPEGQVQGTWEARNWVDGAIRLTCEITSEMESGKVVKRVTKIWEMEDGSEPRKTEEIIYDHTS